MKLLIVIVALVAASVASLHNKTNIRPRHFDTRLPLVPLGRQPHDQRITNGQPAKAKQFPYQAGLLLTLEDGNYWCGGILISDRWVLTAAHCTLGVLEIQVTLGSLLSKPNGAAGELVIQVKANGNNVIVHTKFDDWTLENDVSLIQLPEAITFTDYIKPAKLPSFTKETPLDTGQTAIASGWGLDSDHSESISPTLHYADVAIISNAACAVYYGPLPASNLCIRTKGTFNSICAGDSGGPLMLNGTDIVIGVTSFGVTNGCEVGWPVGFAKVAFFLPWIKEKSGVVP